jgi:hypothetical protein
VNGASSNYEIRADIVSGSLTSGTTGTWLAGDSDNTWTKNAGNCVFTLTIRDKWTTSTVHGPVTIELEA